jgi:hypothetical protein
MSRLTQTLFGGFALCASTFAVAQAPAAQPFYGFAYDLKTNAYLYTEVHAPVVENGREVASTIRYFAPDGREIGRKTLDYRADPYVPTFRFDLPANGPTIELVKISEKGEQHKKLAREDGELVAADSGFDHAVRDHLDALMRGETVRFRFAVAGQLDSYRFKISKVGEGRLDGRPTVKLLVQADSLLRYLAPDLALQYDTETHRLREYKGVSNIHDPATGKAYPARIVYLKSPPADGPKTLPPLTP